MDLDTLNWTEFLPKEILDVTDKINEIGRAVIVGGFVRDALLNISSHDIDIEVYDQAYLETVEQALSSFGTIHSVGKSFGVLIFTYTNFHFDITLARKENKIGIGHKGFSVTAAPFESFETIALRRDFTINAMGYDTKKHLFLDPFHGIDDLTSKRLSPVNLTRFSEDPLRVLRAMGFIGRFELEPTLDLLQISSRLVSERKIQELPPERIFAELDKWLLKSSHTLLGYQFSKNIHLILFPHLHNFFLNHPDQETKLFTALDKAPKKSVLLWSLLFVLLPLDLALEDLAAISHEKKLITAVITYHKGYYALLDVVNEHTNEDKKLFNLKLLAQKIQLKELSIFITPLDAELALWLEDTAKKHSIFSKAIDPLVTGEDLLSSGLTASPEFKRLLKEAYYLQLRDETLTKKAILELILT